MQKFVLELCNWRILTLLLHDGLLLRNLQAGLLALDFFVVAHQLLRDDWLCHSDGNNLDTRGP
jgi:hypothetical protein